MPGEPDQSPSMPGIEGAAAPPPNKSKSKRKGKQQPKVEVDLPALLEAFQNCACAADAGSSFAALLHEQLDNCALHSLNDRPVV